MLFQVGGQGARPTFFEMSAAQQLPASLRSALTYSLGVFALRRPLLHKVLDYEDEFFALLMGVLESHSIRTTDGSFSESLYGLRRRPIKVSVKKSPGTQSSDKVYDSTLRKRQKILSVVFLVVLPYFKSKLQSIYNKEREARLQATLWGQDDVRFDEAGFVLDQEQASQAQNDPTTGEVSNLTRFKKNFASLIGVCYPWIHATNEGFSFAYQLLYLLDATAFYGPALHVLGLHVCRATGQELMMEWWYQSAEERMSAPTVYPPPPPPPTPKVAKDGIPLPSDKTLCPLCCQKRANPSVLSVSGFVFCYSCIFKSVSQHKRCPVTLMPATIEQIRRLFHDL
ncbi:unnamed protein product [Urochloa humidicola]